MTNSLNPIGGYFELELPCFPEYHQNAIALNSGRFCLEYILRCRKYKKVYVPYFTCDSAVEPLVKLGIPYEFYHIDKDYHLVDDISLGENEALMYTNYWGLQDDYCKQLASTYGKYLVLDYTQAFYSRPIDGIDTFYSCRKFFGVPDGGYLYTDAKANFEIEQDESYARMDSLVKRVDLSPEAGYEDFHRVSADFHQLPIRKMSKLTKRMMQGIDYRKAAQCRIENYNLLRQQLGGKKLLDGEIPMIFPYQSEKGQELRKRFIAHKIFVAKYWPNVDEWAGEDALETWMANHILPLPIDQRYNASDIEQIVGVIDEKSKIIMEKEQRVYLRALEPDDYKVSIKWRKDDEIWDMLGGPKYFVSEAYEKKWVEDTIFNSKDVKLAVCLTGSDKYIGNVYMTDINQVNRSCTSHVLIGDKDYWGQGYAREALLQAIDYMFKERNMHRIQALVLVSNQASLKMHQKCGYQIEGTLAEAVFKNGKYQDQYVLALINKNINMTSKITPPPRI